MLGEKSSYGCPYASSYAVDLAYPSIGRDKNSQMFRAHLRQSVPGMLRLMTGVLVPFEALRSPNANCASEKGIGGAPIWTPPDCLKRPFSGAAGN